MKTVEAAVVGDVVEGRKMVDIEYMQRRIGAFGNPNAGVDSKLTVIEEVREMFANGWELFATHYGGDNGNGIVVLHVFVKYE